MKQEIFYKELPDHIWIYPKGVKIMINDTFTFAVIENGELKIKNEEELFQWIQNNKDYV